MRTVTVVTGSARPNSVNQVIVQEVVRVLARNSKVSVEVADLQKLDLPFFNSPVVPAKPSSKDAPESVQSWAKLVGKSDGVIFVAPEYNRSLSAIQKNAIDWLYNEWKHKSTVFVGYGAYSGKYSLEMFQTIARTLNMKLLDEVAQIKLGETVAYDGTILESAALEQLLQPPLDALIDEMT